MSGVAIVEAAQDGKAAGRDQTVNYAPSPELVEVLIASATRPLEKMNEQQQAKIQELQERLGTSDGVLHRVAVLLSEHLKTDEIAFDQIPQRLIDMVRQREALITQQSALPPDPDVNFARIQGEIDAALASGDDARACSLLMEKRDFKIAASKKYHRTEGGTLTDADRFRLRLDAAVSEHTLGELAIARLEYLVASRIPSFITLLCLANTLA